MGTQHALGTIWLYDHAHKFAASYSYLAFSPDPLKCSCEFSFNYMAMNIIKLSGARL